MAMSITKTPMWGSIVPALLFFAMAVHGRLAPPATATFGQSEQDHDPRAQAMYHYGDFSSDRKMYTVELSGEPLVVKHPNEYRERQRHRHVLEYARYLESQQDAIVEQLEEEGAVFVSSYQYVFNGVTLMMTDDQAYQMHQRSDVVRVWEVTFDELLDERSTTTTNNNNYQRVLQPLTHRGQLWTTDQALTGEDIVIGIIDSGIVPENPSFDDLDGNDHPHSYGAAPSSFKGTGCVFGNTEYNPNDKDFTCQGKILAAKCYAINVSNKVGDKHSDCGGDGAELGDGAGHFLSARDEDGHGTHVAYVQTELKLARPDRQKGRKSLGARGLGCFSLTHTFLGCFSLIFSQCHCRRQFRSGRHYRRRSGGEIAGCRTSGPPVGVQDLLGRNLWKHR